MTRKSVADDKYGRLCRRLDEVKRRVDEGTVDYDATMDGLQLLAEGVRVRPKSAETNGSSPYRGDNPRTSQVVRPTPEDLIHGLFIKPEAQIERVRAWNKEFGWDIPDEAFVEVERNIPKWPEEKLVAVVLVPYLPDEFLVMSRSAPMRGIERTFHELWARAKSEQESNWCWDGYDKAGPDRLRLLEGIEHLSIGSGQERRSVLRWEVIDLGCNRNRKPMDVRSAKSSPHASILAAAALHPQWIKSMDGDKVPYVWVPGYEVSVSDENPWQSVPGLSFDRDAREILLRYDWYGDYSSSWAVPSFVRE